ncbi:MAG: protein-glutamate O-methyltransferase CheR [Rhodospirillales bacterium]|nr:protein-glutamate O-methyltransferase CheR [Rhodospirillales bacterium]
MTPAEFQFVADFIYRAAGLVLTADKAYLIDSRLKPVMRERGIAGFADLIARLKAGTPAIVREVTDALTTNETSFFRDLKPFDLFRQIVLPHLLATRSAQHRFRIWSAACSTGQEPYSLAMLLLEERARLAGWTWEIVATDLCGEALAKAKDGVYSQFEVQRGMPTPLLVRYFEKQGEGWRIKDPVRHGIDFRPFNLLGDPAPLGRFDVVFCRNVLIYFDPPTKAKVLQRIGQQLDGDGFLFLGGAETVIGVTDRFVLEAGQRGLYRPAGSASGATTMPVCRAAVGR